MFSGCVYSFNQLFLLINTVENVTFLNFKCKLEFVFEKKKTKSHYIY